MILFEAQIYYFVLNSRFIKFFANDHIHNVFKLDFENDVDSTFTAKLK